MGCIKYKAGRFGEVSRTTKNGKGHLHRSVSVPTSLREMELELKQRLKGKDDLILAVHQCINSNRLDCVLSKMGSRDQVDRNKLIGVFTADVWSELYRIRRDPMKAVMAPEKTLLRQFISGSVRNFLCETQELMMEE